MFEPVEGEASYVRDPETGVVVFTRGTQEVDTRAVYVEFPSGERLRFAIMLVLRHPDRPYVAGDQSNPSIQLLLSTFEELVKDHPGSYEENSKFVRYLLSGLSAINRRWPLTRSPFFYSNLDSYAGRENELTFSFPSNEEIARL